MIKSKRFKNYKKKKNNSKKPEFQQIFKNNKKELIN